MQAQLEKDRKSVLGIPYGFTDDRRFWNLKQFPHLINCIPELKDTPALYEFVRRVNSSGSRFATMGCERWSKGVDYPNGATKEFGTYVDLMFDRVELASPANCAMLVEALLQHGENLRAKDPYSDLSLIRVAPQRVGFHDLNFGAWMCSTWIYGVGNSDRMAQGYRDRALAELANVLEQVSADVTEAHGDKGTTIFDKLSDNGSAPGRHRPGK